MLDAITEQDRSHRWAASSDLFRVSCSSAEWLSESPGTLSGKRSGQRLLHCIAGWKDGLAGPLPTSSSTGPSRDYWNNRWGKWSLLRIVRETFQLLTISTRSLRAPVKLQEPLQETARDAIWSSHRAQSGCWCLGRDDLLWPSQKL